MIREFSSARFAKTVHDAKARVDHEDAKMIGEFSSCSSDLIRPKRLNLPFFVICIINESTLFNKSDERLSELR